MVTTVYVSIVLEASTVNVIVATHWNLMGLLVHVRMVL